MASSFGAEVSVYNREGSGDPLMIMMVTPASQSPNYIAMSTGLGTGHGRPSPTCPTTHTTVHKAKLVVMLLEVRQPAMKMAISAGRCG